jgi:hypothetical protein
MYDFKLTSDSVKARRLIVISWVFSSFGITLMVRGPLLADLRHMESTVPSEVPIHTKVQRIPQENNTDVVHVACQIAMSICGLPKD